MKSGVTDLHTMLLTVVSFTKIGAGKVLLYLLNEVAFCCAVEVCGVTTVKSAFLV